VEKRLAGAKENVLGQMQTVDDVVKTIDRISEETRQLRLKLDKAVKEQKETRKREILNAANEALQSHLCALENSLEKESGGLRVPVSYEIKGDFAGVMKGKKTIASLRSACDDELARAKIEASDLAELIRGNIQQLNEHVSDYKFLFSDFDRICTKPADDFAAIVKSRIADYQAEQAKKEAEQKAREEAATKKEPANPLKDGPEISYRAPDPAERPSAKPESMPNPNDMVQVLADHYGVSFQKAASWLASVEWRVAA
jgi:hypothetical protein